MYTIPNRVSRVLLVSLSPLLLVSPCPAHADIFQWEYINPADPSQGKRQSTTLAPDGAGVDAVPGAILSFRNLTMAYLIGADLTNARGRQTRLTDADLSHATLRFTFMAGFNFTGANLSQADLTGAYLGAWLDLNGIIEIRSDLTSADLTQANLRNASFLGAILAGADLSGAEVREADFNAFSLNETRTGGITLPQLYSTASYRARDLSGIRLNSNDLAGANFAGHNLTNAYFGGSTLTDADFRHANLTNAYFGDSTLTDANFTAADARGAYLYPYPADAITTNLIRPDGLIDGLELESGAQLIVRDDDIGSLFYPDAVPIPITIDQHLAMGPGGTLRMVFEADAWDSTISFAPGIPVTLGGTLELTFADDVNLATQVGRTFDLFDWTGVTPTGAFAVSSPYTWNLSNLYTTGEVTLAVSEPASVALLVLLSVAAPLLGYRNSRKKLGQIY
jgi:uncharacterized protein YjbI with pentapeptide repeats